LPTTSRPGAVEREQRIERAQRNAYLEIGLELRAIRDHGLYKVERAQPVAGRYSFTTFEEYCEQRWEYSDDAAQRLMNAAVAVTKLRQLSEFLPARESHVRPLPKLGSRAPRRRR